MSSQPWNITLDRAAVWQNDELYLPPVDIKALPVNTPTGGWQLLKHPDKTGINLPATVEEHLWGWNGQTFGVTGNYTGVSWFETEVDIPAEWKDRRIAMNIGSVRFRAEIFVNHQLAGYDLVNSTPFSIDITPFIEPGKKNVSLSELQILTGTSIGKIHRFIPGEYIAPIPHTASVVLREKWNWKLPESFM